MYGFFASCVVALGLALQVAPAQARQERSARQFVQYASAGATKRLEINRVKGYLRSWPAILRDAFLCEYAELLYMDDGSLPYTNGGEKFHYDGELEPCRGVRSEAKFIGSNGEKYLWCKEGRDTRAEKPERIQEWRDVKNTMARYGDKAVMDSFSKEIAVLREKFANRNKSAQDIQKEKKQRQLTAKQAAKEANSILKGMQGKLDANSRTALLACLSDNVAPQDALSHTYVNPQGELCFVYEDFLNGCCVEEALEMLDKAQSSEVSQQILARHDKATKAMQKGQRLREIRMQYAQKQYEALAAAMKAKESNGGKGAEADRAGNHPALGRIDKVEDSACRAALVRIAAEQFTPEQLFTETVQDAEGILHTCFDVLWKADMMEQACALMREAAEDSALGESIAKRYAADCEAWEKARERRETLMQAALKEFEAKAAKDKLKRAEQE